MEKCIKGFNQKPEVMRPFGRPWHTREVNITTLQHSFYTFLRANNFRYF
jgi:hypothetical protein